MFRGANKLTLDAKGRMVMPTRYRERLQDRCGGKLVITVDKDQCLLIYPLPDWEEIERKLMRLPPNLREFGMLTRDAMLVGQGLYFELWDEARWNERRDEWLAGGVATADLPAELQTLSL